MKAKTIKAVITKKMNAWWESIDDEALRTQVKKNTIVTGGCIASMFLKEPVNDFDIYFRNLATAEAVANYYVGKFNAAMGYNLQVDTTDGRVRIAKHIGGRGETAGDPATLADTAEIEDTYEQTQDAALQVDPVPATYHPVFLSTNAITVANKVQLVLRFYGEPEDIHKNYDFIHCTNYWASWTGDLTLHKEALESLLSRELRYVGSKYPICSVFRLRKFIKRNWTINAGQILKMAYQISELDLTDVKVLEDQLTGVDVAFFAELIERLKANDPNKVNAAYLVEIIDRMF
jgi:hypothetical protein